MNGYIGNDNRERNERRTDMGGTNSHMGLQLPPLWQEGLYNTPIICECSNTDYEYEEEG